MDIEKVREFVRLAETLNFTDAAHELHMSQSTLSKHVRDIEDALDAQLVERGAHGGKNALTPVGRRFLDLTAPWLAQYDEIVASCRELAHVTPPARIQDMRNTVNINSQLRRMVAATGHELGGNLAYVSVDEPIRRALDEGRVDFAVLIEATETTHAFSGEDLARTYGLIPLAPESLCFLVGCGNPLARRGAATTISTADVMREDIITLDTSTYTNWLNATTMEFAAHGCALNFKLVQDTPSVGGAFPIGPRNLVLCTRRFARYYQDLDVEDVQALDVEEFEPVVYPFLVYRRDTKSQVAREIIRAIGTPADA